MYNVHEIIDSLIEEQYAMFKALVGGNYSGFCTLYADSMSKLAALRNGVKEDMQAKAAQIDDLKAQLKRALESTVEPGGSVEGGETETYNYMDRGE